KPSTDTISVDLSNEPYRHPDGSLLFRPAGHGALLANLNEVDADIIFLKNIDNVVPDRLKEETITYKKVIGGILLDVQRRVFDWLQKLDGTTDDQLLDEARRFIEDNLGYRPAKKPDKDSLVALLNRPIRVCGMVKSEGDPGGGPFWVKAPDGSVSLQVVETAQIDLTDKKQTEIFRQATHFNPVDVVCAVRNYRGQKFDLLRYRDLSTGFVTEKTKDGQAIKAQELPGLWNGSMAYWNTLFVEVPLITFNPVKSVTDLLKDVHQ
ncbi:MAG: DUF4301 family protein, partial [Cyclobacteriaceae bacterium]|nr:DUF4301 family protein [Cyclobacteriaceae bacterium]